MSRMAEIHADLGTIHAILLGQRKVAQTNGDNAESGGEDHWYSRVDCINDLLLELEAAGVVWPDNVVDISPQSAWDKGQEVWSHD